MPQLKKRVKISPVLKELKEIRAVKSNFPGRLKPMLASKCATPFDDEEWIFEVKWDGYRILAHKNNLKAELLMREHQNYTEIYSSVTESLFQIPFSFVLDGEVIMLDKNGKPSFDDLQQVRQLGSAHLVYCVFDILWLEGYSLLKVPLIERKKILKELIPGKTGNIINYPFVYGKGVDLFGQMIEKDMEGIVAKKSSSFYYPGERVKEWLKIPTKQRQEFVIGGWTETDSGRLFRSILFGYYKDGKFYYLGHSGGGFKEKTEKEILERLKKIEITQRPFDNVPDTKTAVHWVKPVLVAEFEFATTTRSGKIRKPAIFKGFRSDKNAKDVSFETELISNNKIANDQSNNKRKKTDITLRNDPELSNWPELKRILKRGSKNHIEIDNKVIQLNNIEEEIWPAEKVTRAELIKYYIDIAEYILPYIQNRPLSLHIKHRAIFEEGIYIKGMEGNQPEWMEVFITERLHKKEGRSKKIDYLVCNNIATLVYIINLGCIDVNPWNSRITNPLNPDYIVIDLDPSEKIGFDQVAETAIAAKKILDKLKLKALIKTSGKTGMHILLPIRSTFTFGQARKIAKRLCEIVHTTIPDITTIEDKIANRGNKVFLDDNQNDYADTIASVYSVRPYFLPNVSTPLEWKELKTKLNPADFNIHNTLKRLKTKGDLFKHIFSKTYQKNNSEILKQFI